MQRPATFLSCSARPLALLAVLLTALLAGCASMQQVQTDVTAFYDWTGAPPGPGTAYRFERLPSQQAVGVQQDYVESLARAALARVGMELKPDAPRFSVQVQLATQVVERLPYGPGYDGFGFATPGVYFNGGNRGVGLGLVFPLGFSEPYYRREVTLLVRDLATSQVVFETRAVNDGVQYETGAVLAAMVDGALRGFPQPPAGTRRTTVEMAR